MRAQGGEGEPTSLPPALATRYWQGVTHTTAGPGVDWCKLAVLRGAGFLDEDRPGWYVPLRYVDIGDPFHCVLRHVYRLPWEEIPIVQKWSYEKLAHYGFVALEDEDYPALTIHWNWLIGTRQCTT